MAYAIAMSSVVARAFAMAYAIHIRLIVLYTVLRALLNIQPANHTTIGQKVICDITQCLHLTITTADTSNGLAELVKQWTSAIGELPQRLTEFPIRDLEEYVYSLFLWIVVTYRFV